jgi:hypothetical protein
LTWLVYDYCFTIKRPQHKHIVNDKTIITQLLFFRFQLFVVNSLAQTSKLNPGFGKEEFLELLKVSSRQADSLYSPDLPAPEKFQKIYRSSEMGLDNQWGLWVLEDKVACISIRGTTTKQVSWLENFYAANKTNFGYSIIFINKKKN